MTQSLPTLFEYPHEIMRANIMLIGCGQHGTYQEDNHECQHCHDMESCIWVNRLPNALSDNNSELQQITFLKYALNNMESYARLLNHDVSTCTCTNCQWISSALNAYDNFDHHITRS